MLTIIGCGNANRRDDAAGVHVARRLRERLDRHPVPGVRALDCGTGGIDVMFAARGSDAVILIDASVSGSEPGAVFEVPGSELANDHAPSLNLHDFRWDHALAAGQKIYGEDFPDSVTVFLIEASDTGLGLEVSPPVEKAIDTVFDRVLERIANHAVARHAAVEAWDISIRRGSIQVPRTLYDAVFDRREGVVPFVLDGALCLMPVEQVNGGLLVKIRNAKGDRVIDAAEFLRNQGWSDWDDMVCTATWESTLGALSLTRQEMA